MIHTRPIRTILTILLAFPAVYAFANSDNDDKSSAANSSPQLLMDAFNVAQSDDPLSDLKEKAVNRAVSESSDVIKSSIKDYIPTFELSLSGLSGENPSYGALGLIPLYETENHLFFNQSSIYYQDKRTTLNLGLGYRHLAYDDKLLLGVNAFYDHEFPYNHSRASIGGEVRTSVAELNTNYYFGLSDWKTGRDGLEEIAMGGYDIELGIALPYMKNFKGYAQFFNWDSEISGIEDISGMNYSVHGQLYSGITLQVGRRFYDSGSGLADANFINFEIDLIKLAQGAAKNEAIFSDSAYEFSSMREKRYEKVRRENIIQKQTRAGDFTTRVRGI